MMIPKSERTYLLRKYAHNVTQYVIKLNNRPMMMSPPYHTL